MPMIEKIGNNPFFDIVKEPSQQPETSKADINPSTTDVLIQVNYESLIEKAKQPPETDSNVIQQARELIASGQFENPEVIRASAENILAFGI